MLWDVADPTFSRLVVFNLGYAYLRGYAKTSYGLHKFEKKKKKRTLCDKHWKIKARFRVGYRRPGRKDIRFGSATSVPPPSLSCIIHQQLCCAKLKINYVWGCANKKVEYHYSRKSAHRWRWRQSHAPAAFYSAWRFLLGTESILRIYCS
jgi:hypothetical protein